MRVLLLDPGLLNRNGHHFHTDLAIFEECRARGIPITLLGHRDVEPDILAQMPVRPVFRASAYPSRDVPGIHSLRKDFTELNRSVEEDLRRMVDFPLGPDDLIFLPTARDIHLTGIYRWYSGLPEPRPKVSFRLVFPPWFRAKAEEHALSVELSRDQMQDWRSLPSDKLFVVAETPGLASFFKKLSGVQATVLPMLIRYPAPVDEVASPFSEGNCQHVIFLGEARREKGFHLLYDAFASILRSYPRLRLTLQASCLFDIGVEEVMRLRSLSANVSLVTHPLSRREYDSLLSQADLVLTAYSPETYKLRTSQIFLEAVGLGKAVIATHGTWMQEQARELGLSEIWAEDFSSDAIASALDRMLCEWPTVVTRARRAAPESRRHHNVSSFIEQWLKSVAPSWATV